MIPAPSPGDRGSIPLAAILIHEHNSFVMGHSSSRMPKTNSCTVCEKTRKPFFIEQLLVIFLKWGRIEIQSDIFNLHNVNAQRKPQLGVQ